MERYQDRINKKFGADYNIPVVFYGQLMAVAFGMDANKDAALNQNIIAPVKLIELAQAGQTKETAWSLEYPMALAVGTRAAIHWE